MKIAHTLTLAAACLCFAGGCSEQTKVETKEALKESGEAVRSAAKDTAENVEGAARKARESLGGDASEPAPAPKPSSP